MVDFKEDDFNKLISELKLHNENVYKHSEKVANLSVKIGENLRLSHYEISELYMGGFLHDIGKLHVSNKILNKKTKITDLERCILQNHVNEGVYIAQKYTKDNDILSIIGLHHMNEDGSGYRCIGGDYNYSKLVAIVHLADTIYKEIDSSRCSRDIAIQNTLMSLKVSKNVEKTLVNLVSKHKDWLSV